METCHRYLLPTLSKQKIQAILTFFDSFLGQRGTETHFYNSTPKFLSSYTEEHKSTQQSLMVQTQSESSSSHGRVFIDCLKGGAGLEVKSVFLQRQGACSMVFNICMLSSDFPMVVVVDPVKKNYQPPFLLSSKKKRV